MLGMRKHIPAGMHVYWQARASWHVWTLSPLEALLKELSVLRGQSDAMLEERCHAGPSN